MFTATAVALALLQAATPNQFDLVCTGEMTSRGRYIPTETKPLEDHYRVNLTNNTWCEGECSRTYTIARVSAAEIVLTDEDVGGMTNLTKISRTTGALVSITDAGSIQISSAGQCSRAAFSGMPSAAF